MDTTKTIEPPLTAEEIDTVREAARLAANNLLSLSDPRLHALAARWRTLVPPNCDAPGERLIDTYVFMYPALNRSGGIDSWAGSESKTVLALLVCTFPTEGDRLDAVREALEVAQWDMGRSEELVTVGAGK